MSEMYDVFISYCRDDLVIMKNLINCFTGNSLNVWVDEKLDFGVAWRSEIAKAIQSSNCLTVILTPNVPTSKWVMEELAYAEEHEKPVYPILASGDSKSSVPFGYMSSNWVDVRSKSLCGDSMLSLIKAIKSHKPDCPSLNEGIQPLVRMTGKWILTYSGAGFSGKGYYQFNDDNNFEATVHNPIFNSDEVQKGSWRIEDNQLLIQGITTLHGRTMPFSSSVRLKTVDVDSGIIEASVISNGYELAGKLKRTRS